MSLASRKTCLKTWQPFKALYQPFWFSLELKSKTYLIGQSWEQLRKRLIWNYKDNDRLNHVTWRPVSVILLLIISVHSMRINCRNFPIHCNLIWDRVFVSSMKGTHSSGPSCYNCLIVLKACFTVQYSCRSYIISPSVYM